MRLRSEVAIAAVMMIGCARTTCPPAPAPARAQAQPHAQAQAQAPDFARASALGAAIAIDLEASPTANLAFELDCMAELTQCSTDAYRQLWTKELGWTSDDEAALVEWKTIHRRYATQIKAKDAEESALALPFGADFGDVTARLRIAGWTSSSTDDYRSKSALLVGAPDATRIAATLARFEPRFLPWWRTRGLPAVAPVVERAATLVREKKLDELSAQVARFYDADLPKGTRVTVHFVARPPNETRHSNGEQVEDHAAIEILPGESIERRIDVVCHELFHFFFDNMEKSARARLVLAFAKSNDSLAIAKYDLLNEAVATALGQGVVELRVLGQAKFDARMARPLAMYMNADIDAAARALHAKVQAALDAGTTLASDEFVKTYLDATQVVFANGVQAKHYLRNHAIAGDADFAPAVDAFEKKVPTNSVSSFAPVEGEGAAFLKRYPLVSAVLMSKPGDAASDAKTAGLAATDVLAIAKLVKRGEPFVYVARRSPKSFAFVLVASDIDAMKRMGERLLAASSIGAGEVR